MPAIIVTADSDPALYSSLMAAWEAERRPGWVMNGKAQYRVVQNTDKQLEFHLESSEGLYGTVSF